MRTVNRSFAELGLAITDIWLPADGIDLQRWAVIACDQHTSDPGYWHAVEEFVAGAPSTLSLIFPEVYLNAADAEQRMQAATRAMVGYVEQGVLRNCGAMAVLVDRRTPQVAHRTGLVVAIDLERYDYRPDSTSLIRASEETILERLPPRVEIRRQATFELPHVLVLIDDPEGTVIEPLRRQRRSFELLYDTELMFGGGSVRGYAVRDGARLQRVADALRTLIEPARLRERYGRDDAMLFAVGDGNHSLATARKVWEDKKANTNPTADDPARYALVEIVNMHDPGLHVEPIHRVVEGIRADVLANALRSAVASSANPHRMQPEAAVARVLHADAAGRSFALLAADYALCFTCPEPAGVAPAVVVQQTLESLEQTHGDALQIDYIHGTDTIVELSRREGSLGIVVPPIDAASLFHYVANNGPLPRKIFSLGEAEEKRYYFESRRIV
ncbi:MAG: DUF1015 domain-containing protein [Spirochaetaceae bacterium]|nr:MAG: DUF1015 domain-containing protein [Spirochaetaceae bacterium]